MRVWTRPNLAAQSLAGRLRRCSSTNARKARIAGSLRAVMTTLGQSRQPQKGCAQGDPASAKGLLWKPAQAASQTSCSPSSNGPTVSRSEEHTSELQSLMRISYAVLCLKTKTHRIEITKCATAGKHTADIQ